MNEFVHLHVHSIYSLLDGLNFIPKLVARAKELGFPALALTDHGRMSGSLEFYRECKKQGVKPIIGCEAYLAHNTGKEPAGPDNPTDHLILLCQNEEGYRNLCRLLTIAEKPPYFSSRPRVDLELLSKYNRGLICSSACVIGPIGRLVCAPKIYNRSTKQYVHLSQDIQGAIDYAGRLKEIFPDRFFLEVMNHTSSPRDLASLDPECRESYDEAMTMETEVLKHARKIATAAGVPWVATNDCHFLDATKHHAHDALMQINTKRSSKSSTGKSRVLRAGLSELYLKDKAAMWALFGHYPELLTNTLWIADQCNVEFEDKTFKIPKFDLPVNLVSDGPTGSDTALEHMIALAGDGAEVRYGKFESTPNVYERIDYEAKVIHKMGVCDYMLIVADFMKEARRRGIFVGPARGSAGGSVLSYCLGITDLDPLRHGLLFERFMNPDRISMPDIDCDFPPDRIDEVIKYVRDKYGHDKVARIATFQTLDNKMAIQRVGSDIYGEDHLELRSITKGMPDKMGEFTVSLAELRKTYTPLKAFIAGNPTDRTAMLDVVEDIVGVKQAASAHAAGILISDKPLHHYLPLMVGSAERRAKDFDAMMHTQAPMDDLEAIGLLKMDFLKVDYLQTIETCIRYIKETQGVDFSFPPEWEIDYNDAGVYTLVQQGRTAGVFQIESDGMRRVCMKLQPETFEQLYAILAIHRPGPMDSIDPETGLTMEENFIRRKRGWQEVTYLMPEIKTILEPTFGVLVYQEQIMQIAQAVCGYTGAEADNLRKGVGKKKPELIRREKDKFVPAALARGHDSQIIEQLWAMIETFARYGFNKSHSVGYGKLTYQTAYLKVHYPTEWMAALLTTKADNEKSVRRYVDEAARMGIRIEDPHINHSFAGWRPGVGGIRFGLRSISGIDRAAEKLVEIRGDEFGSLIGLVDRTHAGGLKHSEIETLITAGCCDFWGKRLTMLARVKERWGVLDKRKRKKEAASPLFKERLEDLSEGKDLTQHERQGFHLKLLSGCYAVDDIQEGTSAIRLVGTTKNQEGVLAAAEIASRHRGPVPLVIGFPTKASEYAWVELTKVRNSNALRGELEEGGVTLT